MNLSVQIDQFWLNNDTFFQKRLSFDFSTPLEFSSRVDDSRAQVYQNWMKNGWVMSNFVKCVSIIAQLSSNYCQKYGHFLLRWVRHVKCLVEYDRLDHKASDVFKNVHKGHVTKLNLVTDLQHLKRLYAVKGLFSIHFNSNFGWWRNLACLTTRLNWQTFPDR